MISTRGRLKFGDDLDIIGVDTTVGVINRSGGFRVKPGRYLLYKDTYHDLDETERIVLYHESMHLPDLLQRKKITLASRDGFHMSNDISPEEIEEAWRNLDEKSRRRKSLDELLNSENDDCYFLNEDGDTLTIQLDSEYQSLDVYRVDGVIVGFLIEGVLYD